MLKQVQVLVKLPQREIKCKPISFKTAECMVGIEVLILHIGQLCLQPSQLLSGLPNFTPASIGSVFREAVPLVHWSSAPSHRISSGPSAP